HLSCRDPRRCRHSRERSEAPEKDHPERSHRICWVDPGRLGTVPHERPAVTSLRSLGRERVLLRPGSRPRVTRPEPRREVPDSDRRTVAFASSLTRSRSILLRCVGLRCRSPRICRNQSRSGAMSAFEPLRAYFQSKAHFAAKELDFLEQLFVPATR